MLTKADAVVIGGGITGCSIAYNLSKRGKRVVVLEKDDVAYEASGRTVAAVGLLGKQAGEFELARASLAIYDSLSEDIGYDIEFVKKGRLYCLPSRQRTCRISRRWWRLRATGASNWRC